MLKTLSAAALTLIFSVSANVEKQGPIIAPANVNARSIGSCELYDPEMSEFHPNVLRPLGAIGAYVESYQKAFLQEWKPTDYFVKYIEKPKNGMIKSVTEDGWSVDYYVPMNGFKGNDRYVAEVTVKGVKFKVVGFIRPSSDVMSGYDDICRSLGLPSTAWKIVDVTNRSINDLARLYLLLC